MRLYYFVLKAGRNCIPDTEGMELPDGIAARRHAIAVAKELMRHQEAQTLLWRIQVCDDYLRPLFEVFFAHLQDAVARYPSDYRMSVQRVAQAYSGFDTAVLDTKLTLQDVRETLARAERLLALVGSKQET
jgi:hypothetical protein